MVAGALWDWWGGRQRAQELVEPGSVTINPSLAPILLPPGEGEAETEEKEADRQCLPLDVRRRAGR